MADWPKLYHPASYDPTGVRVVAVDVTVEGFQLTPDTWAELSAWCGGLRSLDPGGRQALQVAGQWARLGDYVMRRGDQFTVAPADGHYQRWAAVDEP